MTAPFSNIRFFKIVCAIIFCFCSISFVSAQETKKDFYQGTVDNRPVRFYLKQHPNECGGDDTYQAIYQYGKGKKWILLLNQNDTNGNFCFTEARFTGVLILKKTTNVLEGVWISPDAKRQLKVKLTKQKISKIEMEELEERLEKTHYENFDC